MMVHRIPPWKPLAQWKLIFHYPLQDRITFHNAAEAIRTIARVPILEAENLVLEACESDEVLILITHKEQAELYVEQFTNARLTVTILPAA